MPEIQITSQNYNGKTVDVIFYSINNPEVGVSLGTYTVPFIYSSPDCFGVYELYPSEYEGKMCQVVMNPTPTPTPTVTPTTTPNLITRDSYYYDNTLLLHFDNRTGIFDPYGDNVSLLMRMDGTNNSTSFVDSSINKKTITAINNAKISSSQSKSGGASAYFDGGSMLSVTSSTDFDLGNVYTVEAWILSNDTSRDAGVLCRGQYQGYQGGRWDGLNFSIRTSSAVTVYFWANWYYDEQLVTVQNALVQGQWTHVAVVRNGTNGYVYINGVLGGSISNLNSNGASSRNLLIGRWDYDRADESGVPSHMYFDGHIDDVRITKGIARYDSNFTPPSAPLPPVLPLFKDSSAYDNNLIVSSAVITSNDSKFGGYSGYFNGSSFVRSAGTDIWQLGTDDFTIESWINPSSVSNRRSIVGNYDGSNGGWALSIKQPSGGTPTYGPEVSFVATSYGSEVDIIIPGVLEITRGTYYQIYNSAVESSADQYSSPANTSWNCEGWTNVCNYSSRSYYNWRTSLQNVGKNPQSSVGVEMLMKHDSTNRVWLVKMSNWQAGGGGAFAYTRKELLSCSVDSSIIQFRNGDGSVIEKTTSSVIPTETWSHIAAVRSSGILKLFLDGTQIGSDSSFTDNITRNNSYGLSVGATILSNGTTSDYFSGYLDDLRITKGTARYANNFNVPTKAFSDFGPLSTVPSTPTNLSVSEDQGVVSLSWTRPSSPKLIDGRAPITYYGVEYSSDSGSSWTEHSVVSGGSLLTRNISSLSANTPYSFRVRAQNSVGFGDYSNTAQIIVPQTSPTILSAIPDDGQAYVSWDPPLTDAYYSNVSLLLKADSSPIVDSSSSPKTVSAVNAPVSSSQSKFGASSIYLSPSNASSYLAFAQSDSLNFGTGDFTIEFWIYPNSTNDIRRWVNCEKANGLTIRGGNGGGIEIYALNSSNNYSFINASSVSVGQWQHIAVVRYNGTVYAYKNGNYIGSNGSISYAIDMNGLILGSNGGEMPDCYIDDFRITKGVARYTSTTSNFTAPTTEFLPYSPNNSSIRDYAVQYSSNEGISWITFSHSATTNTLINVTGLNNASNYIFRVAAVNFAGTGVYSDNSSSITVAPRTDSLHNKTRLLLHLDSNQ
jgi:hypothetical protein